MNLLRTLLLGTAISFSFSDIGRADKVFIPTHIIEDEGSEWADSDRKSVSRLISEVRLWDEKERKEVEVLSLQGALLHTAGVEKIVSDLLPLFPSLKVLDITCTSFDGDESADVVLAILRKYSSLEYLNIDGNLIAYLPEPLLKKTEMDSSLRETLMQKVIITPKSMVETVPKLQSFPDWRMTHQRFYEFWIPIQSQIDELLGL